MRDLSLGTRRIGFRSNIGDLSYLLTERELETVAALNREYHSRYRKPASEEASLVYFLGDSATFTKTWSATSKRLPTFRRNAACGKFWFPSKRRWMTNKEKLPGCKQAVRPVQKFLGYWFGHTLLSGSAP